MNPDGGVVSALGRATPRLTDVVVVGGGVMGSGHRLALAGRAAAVATRDGRRALSTGVRAGQRHGTGMSRTRVRARIVAEVPNDPAFTAAVAAMVTAPQRLPCWQPAPGSGTCSATRLVADRRPRRDPDRRGEPSCLGVRARRRLFAPWRAALEDGARPAGHAAGRAAADRRGRGAAGALDRRVLPVPPLLERPARHRDRCRRGGHPRRPALDPGHRQRVGRRRGRHRAVDHLGEGPGVDGAVAAAGRPAPGHPRRPGRRRADLGPRRRPVPGGGSAGGRRCAPRRRPGCSPGSGTRRPPSCGPPPTASCNASTAPPSAAGCRPPCGNAGSPCTPPATGWAACRSRTCRCPCCARWRTPCASTPTPPRPPATTAPASSGWSTPSSTSCSDPAPTASPRSRPQLTIIATISTLLGGDDPGEISGDVVPADTVRALARTLGLLPAEGGRRPDAESAEAQPATRAATAAPTLPPSAAAPVRGAPPLAARPTDRPHRLRAHGPTPRPHRRHRTPRRPSPRPTTTHRRLPPTDPLKRYVQTATDAAASPAAAAPAAAATPTTSPAGPTATPPPRTSAACAATTTDSSTKHPAGNCTPSPTAHSASPPPPARSSSPDPPDPATTKTTTPPDNGPPPTTDHPATTRHRSRAPTPAGSPKC